MVKYLRKRPVAASVRAESNLRCDDDACLPYFVNCDYVFSDVLVLPAREGNTVVQWTLGSSIRDTGTYTYSLLTGNAGVDDLTAWKTVAEEPETFFLVDPERRLPGTYSFTHYRIKLRTGERIYYSIPLHTLGRLNYADQCELDAIIRAENIQISKEGIEGIVLKKKISGIPCKRCRDFNTEIVTDGKCPVCYGTGWVGGYYKPVECYWLKPEPIGSTIEHDVEVQGPVVETQLAGRSIAPPVLVSGDVWINRCNSERYRITAVKHIVEMKGVPAVYQLVLERIPFSDIIYTYPVYRAGQ